MPETVSLSIANTSIPEPFEVVFSYPVGTVIVYNSVPYTCTTACPPISVELTADPAVLAFVVTLPAAGTYDVGVSLFDSDWSPADRLLASASATGVVVNGNFAVTGTFSMQGNTSREGIPVIFTWGGTLVPYSPTGYSTAAISNNFSLTLTYGGTYTITTSQPRYLNITADLNKKVTISSATPLDRLELKGGNAVWSDNIINLQDASKVGSEFGWSGTTYDSDVNFDGKVNIQDLALVGGDYSKESSTVYSSWIP